MEFVDQFARMGTSRGPTSLHSLFKLSALSPPVQSHMRKVYSTLALAMLACMAGAYVGASSRAAPLLGTVGFLACAGWLSWTPATPSAAPKRRRLLLCAAASQGAVISPLLAAAAVLHPGALLLALGGTATIFACFSLAALVAARRSYLFLGGMLGSATMALLGLRLGSWMLGAGARLVWETELYLGLLVFMGYVVYDTQVIVERAEAGDRDEIGAALGLFVDALAIFVRVLVLLMRSGQHKSEQREARRGGRQPHRSRVH